MQFNDLETSGEREHVQCWVYDRLYPGLNAGYTRHRSVREGSQGGRAMSRERKQYHSIPLRTHQQRPQTPQERTTEGNIAVPSDILRPLDTRAPNQRTYAATHSHVPHTTLPAVPDDDRRLRRAPQNAGIH